MVPDTRREWSCRLGTDSPRRVRTHLPQCSAARGCSAQKWKDVTRPDLISGGVSYSTHCWMTSVVNRNLSKISVSEAELQITLPIFFQHWPIGWNGWNSMLQRFLDQISSYITKNIVSARLFPESHPNFGRISDDMFQKFGFASINSTIASGCPKG